MVINEQWFWCRGCHRAFSAEAGVRTADDGAGEARLLDFRDMSSAVVCPFEHCGATHVMPWSVMCRAYMVRFGWDCPWEPEEGERYDVGPSPVRLPDVAHPGEVVGIGTDVGVLSARGETG